MATKHIWASSAAAAKRRGGGKTVVATKANLLKRQPKRPSGKGKNMRCYSVTTHKKVKPKGRKRRKNPRKKNPRRSKASRRRAALKGWRKRRR